MSYKIKKEYLHVKDDQGRWITVDALADSPASARLAEQLSLALDAIADANYISCNEAENELTGKLILTTKDLEIQTGNLFFSNPRSKSSENGIRWLVSNTKTENSPYHKIYHELDTDNNQVLKLKYHTYNFDANDNLLSAETGDEKILLSSNGQELNLCEEMSIDYATHNVTLTQGNLTLSNGKLVLTGNDIELKNKGNIYFSNAASSSSQNGIRWLVSSTNEHRIYWEMDTTTNQLLQIRYQTYHINNDNSTTAETNPPILFSMSHEEIRINTPIMAPTINNPSINNAIINTPSINNASISDSTFTNANINNLVIGNNWEFKQIDLKAGGTNGVVPSKITGTLVYQLNLTPDQIYILSMWTPGYIPEFFVSGAETTGGNIPCGIALKGLDGEYKDVITSSTEKTIYITYLKQKTAADLTWASAAE